MNDTTFKQKRILVRFANKDDMGEFSKLIGVQLHKKITNFTYKQPHGDNKNDNI